MSLAESESGRDSGSIGIDTGGTFTDFVWMEGGRLRIHKQPSTRDDPARAVLDGIALLDLGNDFAVVHGSTVATNALLERRGARTALITTRGFADVLAIGRQDRPDLYALVPQKPEPLVPSRWRYEVDERVTAEGKILIPLQTDQLPLLWKKMAREKIESVAICLLFSFLDHEHEREIARSMAAQWPFAAAPLPSHTLSSELLPEYREFERTSTTVINAYVMPLMKRYLRRLADGLHPRRITIMQSNGGVMSAEAAGSQAARTVLSGPAGGVVGARFVAAQSGLEDIISFDMGGTSTDVALSRGRLPTTGESEIGGLPLRLPMIDIHTVGSGGGSLALVDAGGALLVGPQSAGADPGPVCYGFPGAGDGQLWVTTTDANLILGRLDADHFLGGTIPLDFQRALAALEALARQLGASSAEAAAADVVHVANATMERAIRRVSVERGYDPRHFTLVAFGGAGPLHACDLAQSMQIPRVLVPQVPGVLSALGMLAAAPTMDYSQTIMVVLDAVTSGFPQWLAERFERLESRAQREMAAQGYADGLVFRWRVDARYQGQSYELEIDCNGTDDRSSLAARFHRQHEQRFGYSQPETLLELVNLRLVATAPVTLPVIAGASGRAAERASQVEPRTKMVWFEGAMEETAMRARSDLDVEKSFSGPMLILQYDTTTVIPPGWQGYVDVAGNLILSRLDVA